MKSNNRKVLKIAVDVAMAAVLVAVMATALVQEVPHEWLGLALFVLLIAHIVLNRRWLGSVFRGRHNAVRILQIVTIAGLLVCMLGQVASSLVISKHAFAFLPALPGAAWARRVHMICSYWSFVLAFAHAGLHVRAPRKLQAWQVWALRIAFFVVAAFGAYSFVRLGLPAYLAGQVQFAAMDAATPLWLVIAQYASVAVLVAGLFYYLRKALGIKKADK